MTESAYIEAIGAYRTALRKALNVADDPYKAPELVVETAWAVQEASWNMQVEYAAMNRDARRGTTGN